MNHPPDTPHAGYTSATAVDGGLQLHVERPHKETIVASIGGELTEKHVSFFLSAITPDKTTETPAQTVLVLACDELEYVSPDARRTLIDYLQQQAPYKRIVCQSKHPWAYAFWQVLKVQVPQQHIEVVPARAQATEQIGKQHEDTAQRKAAEHQFAQQWNEELCTQYFDRYLLKCIAPSQWRMHDADAHFFARFVWIEFDILYLELSGQMHRSQLRQLLALKAEVIAFLKALDIKNLRVLINTLALSTQAWPYLKTIEAHGMTQAIVTERYVLSRNLVDQWLHQALSLVRPKLRIRKVYRRLGDAVRELKGFEHPRPKSLVRGKTMQLYYDFLQKKQQKFYQSDERFRRKVFAQLSRLVSRRNEPAPSAVGTKTYLENEIFHCIEILTADFQRAYAQLAEHNRQLQQMRSVALQQQLNPHFIFNSINSIFATVFAKNTQRADSLLVLFAQLMRKVIENAQHEHIALSDEVEFLASYLQLERTRANQSFEWSFEIQAELKRNLQHQTVPPMIVQPFIEKALWHRLMPRISGKQLLVRFELLPDYLLCSVIDNGVGLQQSAHLRGGRTQTSGTQTAHERIEAHNAVWPSAIKVFEEDLYEDDQLLGSQTQLYFPTFKNKA